MHPILKSHIQFEKEVILFALIITVEFKRGNLTSNDYRDFKDLNDLNSAYVMFNFETSVNSILNNNKTDDKIESDLEKFYKKYLLKHIEDYFFYPTIYEFILTGYLNTNKLDEELKNRIPEQPSIENSTFSNVATNSFRNLSNEEFKENVKRLLLFAKQGKYDPVDYFQISKFLNFYSENSIIDETKDKIRELLLEGLDIAKENIVVDRRLENLMFGINQDSSDDESIKAKIIEYITQAKKKLETKNTNSLLVSISENNLEKMNDIFEEYNIKKELFQNFSAQNLWAHLQMAENKTFFYFIKLLEKRHGFSNIKDYYFENITFFKEIISLTINSANSSNLQDIIKKELIVALEKICEKME